MGTVNRHIVVVSYSRAALVVRAAGLLAVVLMAMAVISAFAGQVAYATVCVNETLRSSLGSSLLPDCRAYEMVTPSYKAGYTLQLRSFASDGEKIVLGSVGAFADPPASGGGVEGNFYLGTRSADGWRLSSLMVSRSEFVGQELIPGAYEANNGMSLWEEKTPQQSARTDELYVRSASGGYTLVGTLTPDAETSTTNETANLLDSPIAATSTYQHIVLSANSPGNDYWGFDKTTGSQSLYEYSGTGNSRPVLVAARGPKVERGEEEELLALCGAELGGAGHSVYNALSSDGETIFFTLTRCTPSPQADEVYARLHGARTSTAAAEPVDVGASECSEGCGTEESGRNFEGASENGEKVFLTSTQKLTNDAGDLTAGGSATEEEGKPGCAKSTGGCNLYEYDFELKTGHRLILVAGGAEDVRGVAAIAEDGTRLYYVAEGSVTGALENEFHRSPTPGEPNLYVYDTDTGVTSYIATLSQKYDEEDWISRFRRPVEVTGEDGRFLLFASAAPGVTPGEASGEGIVQLFEYDAQTGELVRVTQGERVRVAGGDGEEAWNADGNGVTVGINPKSISKLARALGEVVDFSSGTDRLNIAGDGKTVVFETAGELSPLAWSSATLGCPSVYEFRSEGAIGEGAVHLVSDGRDATVHKGEACGAEFVGMDEDGDNILFSTTNVLLASDVDGGQANIYDARVGGGFPPSPVTGEPGSCAMATCERSAPAGGAGLPGVAPSDAEGNAGTGGASGLGAELQGSGRSMGAKSKGAGENGGSSKRHGRGARRVCRRRQKKRRHACGAFERRKQASNVRGEKKGGGA